ncbi:MAG: AI-2E family transporter [Pseudomonadota bacterium]
MRFRWILLAASLAFFAMFSSFLFTVFTAACLAIAFRPFTSKIEAKRGPITAAIVAVAIAFACIATPIAMVTSFAAPQAVQGLAVLDEMRESGWINKPEVREKLSDIDDLVKKVPGFEGGLRQVAQEAASMAGTAARAALKGGVGLAGGALNAAMHLVVILMLIFTFTVSAASIKRFGLALIPIPVDMYERCTQAYRGAVMGVLAGVVLVAAIQGLLCGIAFTIAGVPQAAFWAFLATMVAPIPMVGTAMVWGPICIWLWFSAQHTAAIGLLAWCAIVVSGSDNIIRPIFLKNSMDAPISLIFLSIICGMVAFGPMGLLVGPVLLAMGLQLAKEGLAMSDNGGC